MKIKLETSNNASATNSVNENRFNKKVNYYKDHTCFFQALTFARYQGS